MVYISMVGPVVELADFILDDVVYVAGGRHEHVRRQVAVDHHPVTTQPVPGHVGAIPQLPHGRLAQLLLCPVPNMKTNTTVRLTRRLSRDFHLHVT